MEMGSGRCEFLTGIARDFQPARLSAERDAGRAPRLFRVYSAIRSRSFVGRASQGTYVLCGGEPIDR